MKCTETLMSIACFHERPCNREIPISTVFSFVVYSGRNALLLECMATNRGSFYSDAYCRYSFGNQESRAFAKEA